WPSSACLPHAPPPPERRQEFALLQLDLDWFKDVNDRFGHAAGDAVLQCVAEILRRETRCEDIISRIGGDEFLILMPGSLPEPVLRQLGQRLITATQQPIRVGEHLCHVSASIGAAMTDRYQNLTGDGFLADCDSALYAAKRSGRGCIRIHASKADQR
ncbi:MAG: GGDEF domain-containing protein, partial [Paracoccus sp. (in: a-proteobacteria)]|nr:GGDEF domain-containing protein [Paracoccus sp. (in: a-proteobacteria)]